MIFIYNLQDILKLVIEIYFDNMVILLLNVCMILSSIYIYYIYNSKIQYLVLSNSFPELKITVPKANRYSPYEGYWNDINNQIKFVESVAAKFSILKNKNYIFYLFTNIWYSKI